MRSDRKKICFNTSKKRQFIGITNEVIKVLLESASQEEFLLCHAMNMMVSIFIDDETRLYCNFEEWLECLAFEKSYDLYFHHRYKDHASIKRTIFGWEVVAAFTNGKADLELWKQIFYGEFDEIRRKKEIIGE